ncbi:hypothetical protein [Brevibacterium zhoupengii]|uniref:hypothetical protein n=1 Tax=Brevibacterium zhoupengii TaxID=2898795 RepID=UPI001E3BD3DF|nr:hypothetical protein [Brevibacterium zhoupengii]
MGAETIELERLSTGEFLVHVGSGQGGCEFVLALSDAEETSDGVLADDEATAHATTRFLLAHQSAGDLPERLDITDITAAYDGAIDAISRFGNEQPD